MSQLAFATIKELKEKLHKKELSPQELLEVSRSRFACYDKELGSALEVFDTESILAASTTQGVLAGIPGLIKDNICMKSRITSCASKILENFHSTYDATVIARLKEQGALLVGRGNMDEFAMGSSNEYSAFYPVKNPWDKTRVAGGSSGGPITAVAAGFVPWALGSETGGSVRLPAAWCGIVGLKPTYGHVSRYGLVAYASSLDQIGVATRSVYDNALVFSVIAGHDEKDSSTLAVVQKDYTANLDGKLPEGLRIGVIDNALNAEGVDEEVKQAVEDAIKMLASMGAHVKRVQLSTLDYAAAAYFIISRAEAASNLARFDGVRYGYRDKEAHTLAQMYEETRGNGFGRDVRLRILVGNYVLRAGYADAYYENAKKVQRLIRKEFVEMFRDVDVLVAPVHAVPAFKFGACADNPLQMDLTDYFTCFVNLAGIPAISVPCGFTKSKLPIGFQLIGSHLAEELLFKVGHAYEQQTPWHAMHPMGFE